MDAATLPKNDEARTTAGSGELVLQNGRQAGARRALGVPATFLGREAPCDIRLNVDGVDTIHCVILCGPDGFTVRDLNSVTGTFVNGQRIEQTALKDGDVVKIGPFEFKLEATVVRRQEKRDEQVREALRIQAAAVAAQQIALDEEEARLRERRQNLQQQEEQLAGHLAEKQRQIQLWSDYTKAERESLRKQKTEHEQFVTTTEQELAQAKETLVTDQKNVAEEKARIDKVYQRLRKRWHKQWGSEKEKFAIEAHRLSEQIQAIADARRDIEDRTKVLREEIAKFQAEREHARREHDQSREALENAQALWRERRTKERLVLKLKLREIEKGHIDMEEARRLLAKDKDAWRRQQRSLEAELQGLNRRVVHQRARVQRHEDEIAKLDQLMRQRRGQVGNPRKPEIDVPADAGLRIAPETVAAAPRDERIDGLHQLSGDLADQRIQLMEQYSRLTQIHQLWHTQREQASAELEALAQRLADHEQALAERDQQALATEEKLRERQEEIEVIRQEMQVWRAQMRARDKASEDEHAIHLLALREKETLLQQQLDALGHLRQRWKDRRQEESEHVLAMRHQLEQQQKEMLELRASLFAQIQELEEQKRILAEKALALEQYRQETFGRADDPVAERRVERLRRRWLSVNAALIRSAKSEREAVLADLGRLEAERAQVAREMERLTVTEGGLAERQSVLDKREADLKARILKVNAHEPDVVERAA